MIPTSIDGTDVQEITVDGDVVFSAAPSIPPIPNSAVAQYNARLLTGFSDGDPVTTRPDQVGSLDLTGNAVFRASGLNGLPTVDYNGSSDSHNANGPAIQQKVIVYLVIDGDFNTSSTNWIIDSFDGETVFGWNANRQNWVLYAGNVLDGSSNINRNLFTVVIDGSNSIIREDGTQTASGFAGNFPLELLEIGQNDQGSTFFDGDIPFVEIHDGNVSNGLLTREQEIADMFNITI